MISKRTNIQVSQHIWPCSDKLNPTLLPFFIDKISAGFPSPAEGYTDRALDLNDLMIENPPATFFVKVEGDSMKDAGIFPGDMLIVNRSKDPVDGKIIIAVLNGELTVKRLRILKNKTISLEAENSAYQPILVSAEHAFTIWGVVTGVVRSL